MSVDMSEDVPADDDFLNGQDTDFGNASYAQENNAGSSRGSGGSRKRRQPTPQERIADVAEKLLEESSSRSTKSSRREDVYEMLKQCVNIAREMGVSGRNLATFSTWLQVRKELVKAFRDIDDEEYRWSLITDALNQQAPPH